MDVNELQGKLNRLQSLITNKKKLLTQLSEVEEEINIILSQVHVKPKKKGNLSLALHNYISRAMAPGAHMTPKEIARKVKEFGYESTNPMFSSYIQQRLLRRDDIKKIGRGVYCRIAKVSQINNHQEDSPDE